MVFASSNLYLLGDVSIEEQGGVVAFHAQEMRQGETGTTYVRQGEQRKGFEDVAFAHVGPPHEEVVAPAAGNTDVVERLEVADGYIVDEFHIYSFCLGA